MRIQSAVLHGEIRSGLAVSEVSMACRYGQFLTHTFMENAMRDLSMTLCRGIARQVLASAPLRARPDGRPVLPGRPVSTDGLA